MPHLLSLFHIRTLFVPVQIKYLCGSGACVQLCPSSWPGYHW